MRALRAFVFRLSLVRMCAFFVFFFIFFFWPFVCLHFIALNSFFFVFENKIHFWSEFFLLIFSNNRKLRRPNTAVKWRRDREKEFFFRVYRETFYFCFRRRRRHYCCCCYYYCTCIAVYPYFCCDSCQKKLWFRDIAANVRPELYAEKPIHVTKEK